MGRFLSSLDFTSTSTSESNSLYTIDRAGKYFNKVKRQKLIEDVKAQDVAGNSAVAEELLVKYSRVELGTGSGIDVVQDEQNLIEAFEETQNVSLILYPGALGNFFRNSLYTIDRAGKYFN